MYALVIGLRSYDPAMAERQVEDAGGAAIRTSTAIALIGAGPYALALVYYGLRSVAWGSKPKTFGVEYYSDNGTDFPNGPTLYLGLVVVAIALALIASLVVLAKERHPSARWLVLGWLLIAVLVVSVSARHPGESRRCFIDGYSETQVCYSSRTIVVRDVVLRSAPAAVAVGSLLIGARGSAGGSRAMVPERRLVRRWW